MRKNLQLPFGALPSQQMPHQATRTVKAIALLGLAMAMASGSAKAQFALNCPPNMVVSSGAGCNAQVVTYPLPTIANGAVTDTTFAYTGTVQMYVVPASVGQITIEAWGAQGQGAGTIVGGLGGYSTGQLAVTPGETLYVYVGGGGAFSITGGYNGGGNGGTTSACTAADGGGGGGATDLRQGGQALANRVIVGGGGGGAGGNRMNGCGRGSGGGGGGGYYGGGGGSGWPGAGGGTAPTGGTQTAGGAGGIATSTAGATNGISGILGVGGAGGNEVGSNQGGGATSQPGGTGGGATGGPGVFNTGANWTGQSGAGGSGYIGTLTSSSMTAGIRTGNGQLRIVAPVNTTLVQTAGLPSGSTFPLGTTTNAFTVTQLSNSDSCSFTITVQDITPPTFTCPTANALTVDSNCVSILPDYTPGLGLSDNCDPNPAAAQTPPAGSAISYGPNQSVTVVVADITGNMDTCTFALNITDNQSPVVLSCPPLVTFTPNTLDCDDQVVNFSAPLFADNCAFLAVGSHQPGQLFAPGSTVVTYVATDSAGNTASCNFVVSVESPVLDGLISGAPVCDGAIFTLNAQSGFNGYVWSTGSTTNSITSQSPGIFWVDVSDINGCIGRDSFTYAYPALPVPVVTATGAQVCTGPYATYQWYMNGAFIPGATSQCYQATASGSYSVVITDSIGCTGISDTTSVVVVSARDGFSGPAFELYPNPARDQVQIRFTQPVVGNGSLRLFDLAGSLVKEANFADFGSVQTLDLKGLAAGSYVVEVVGTTSLGRRKFVLVP